MRVTPVLFCVLGFAARAFADVPPVRRGIMGRTHAPVPPLCLEQGLRGAVRYRSLFEGDRGPWRAQLRQTYGLLLQRAVFGAFHESNRRTMGQVRGTNAGAAPFPFVIYNVKDQYFFGDSLLVAPIAAGVKSRKVLLPAGRWYDFRTGKFAGSNQTIAVMPAHRRKREPDR